jgi:hypothetical protein
MSTFGFYPGPINYWMLVTDWRGGSIAIMLAIGALIAGYFACPRCAENGPPGTNLRAVPLNSGSNRRRFRRPS